MSTTLTKFLKGVSGTVAAIPGLTVILTNIGAPDTFSAKLMGGLVTASSGFIVGYAFAKKKKILTWNTRFDRLAVALFISFLVFFFIYSGITNDRILNSTNHASGVLKPFWLSDQCLQQIHNDNYSNLKYFYEGKGPIDTENLLRSKSAFSYGTTVGAIYLSFISLFGFLTASFVSLWLYFEIVDKGPQKKAVQSSDPTSMPASPGRK